MNEVDGNRNAHVTRTERACPYSGRSKRCSDSFRTAKLAKVLLKTELKARLHVPHPNQQVFMALRRRRGNSRDVREKGQQSADHSGHLSQKNVQN